MSDYLWPVDIVPSSQTWKIIDPVAVYNSPLSGATRTVARAGARLGCTITVPMTNGANRARVMALLANLRGRSNRVWLPDYSTTQRGSFSAPELLSNNDFSNGTTGWTSSGSLTVTDRSARLTATSVGVGLPSFYQINSGFTAYAPYAYRTFVRAGAQDMSAWWWTYIEDASSSNTASGAGLRVAPLVASSAAGATQYALYSVISAGYTAGAYLDVDWTSLARCALVDNGQNALLYANDLTNAAWTKVAATVASGLANAPDGTSTVSSLVETAVTSAHQAYQTATVASAAADFTFCVAIAPGTRGFVMLAMQETASSTVVYNYFNTSTGAVGSSGAGANWSNVRAFSRALGGGWFMLCIVARKTNAATGITASISAATADGTNSYLGVVGTPALYAWRATLAQSSVPVRLTSTTSAATTGTAQTGSKLYLKGLPASTSGLLKVGDPVQIGNQINFCTAPLDSDAAGLGMLQVGLPWRQSPADNDPVIINKPMAKMILASEDISWDTQPGQFSPFTLDLVEDVT